ncbi:hypothetical protein M407DRAFT_192129 [Tulasnella calospora MUT 4182]|uniref:Uncharacterized protein n=1 Tax=Tulasnella calospora MUT 4182 TaxID=1051891 RepID=A0A0C3LHJ1_9AGAM|nr:hypothetical protein M407DRAFT_192129 [Tulasnella calospora MUT 4182]
MVARVGSAFMMVRVYYSLARDRRDSCFCRSWLLVDPTPLYLREGLGLGSFTSRKPGARSRRAGLHAVGTGQHYSFRRVAARLRTRKILLSVR